jgi:ubiquitin-protein ligase
METTSKTLRRIFKEYADMESDPSLHFRANPINMEEPYEWHFTIRGTPETEFHNGLYHGKFTLPVNYPFAPPTIMLLTPNGRFETNKKICLSISNFHPELWQPAWGIRTMLEALRSFFPSPPEGAVGALDWPVDVRKELAQESITWQCPVCKKKNMEILEVIAEKVENTQEKAEAENQEALDEEQQVEPEPASDLVDFNTAEEVVEIEEELEQRRPHPIKELLKSYTTDPLMIIVDIQMISVFAIFIYALVTGMKFLYSSNIFSSLS